MSDIERDEHRAVHEAITRRRLLASGAGLGAAGALIVGPAGPAIAQTTSPTPGPAGRGAVFGTGEDLTGSPTALGPAALPVAVPGAVMRTLGPFSFVPAALYAGASLVGFASSTSVYCSAGQALAAPLDLPPGATLVQVDGYAYATNATPPVGQWTVLRFDTQGGSTVLASATPPTGPGLKQQTFTLQAPVDGMHEIAVNLTGTNATYAAVAVTYQYLPPPAPGTVVMLPAPVRAYDSRPGNPPLTGTKAPLANGATRLVDTKAGGSGAPGTAAAVLVNLTVVNTSASGFLTAYKPGGAVPAASTINWFTTGEIVANTTLVACDEAIISCYVPPGSSTDVLVDVVGYLR